MKAQEKEASQRDTSISQKECCAGKHKTFSPLRNPPSRDNVEDCSCEKLYISMVQEARRGDDDENSPFVVGKRRPVNRSSVLKNCVDVDSYVLDEGERESKSEIYNLYVMNRKRQDTVDFGLLSEEDEKLIIQHDQVLKNDTGQPLKKRRGKYRNNVVFDRINWFVTELDLNVGLIDPKFNKPRMFSKQELKYWIQRLGLAQDRLTVNQYLKRFLMFGYVAVKSNQGKFYFVSKTPSQPTIAEIVETKDVMMSIRALTHTPRKRKSY